MCAYIHDCVCACACACVCVSVCVCPCVFVLSGLGRKGVYLYNLPESESAYKYLKVPGVSARFGTDPFFWNWAMWLTARLVPRSLLNNRDWVKGFAKLSDPLVRAVDAIAGEAVVSGPVCVCVKARVCCARAYLGRDFYHLCVCV